MTSNVKDVWKVVLVILQGVMLPVGGYFAAEVIDQGKVIAGIQQSRFTSADGAEVWKEIGRVRQANADALASIRSEIMAKLSAIETDIARIPRDNPPDWFREQVEDLKTEMRQYHQELTSK